MEQKGEPDFGKVGVVRGGLDEISFVEAVLVPASAPCDGDSAAGYGSSASRVSATFEQQTLRIDRAETATGQDDEGLLHRAGDERSQEPPANPEPPPSPYAKRL